MKTKDIIEELKQMKISESQQNGLSHYAILTIDNAIKEIKYLRKTLQEISERELFVKTPLNREFYG